MESSAKVNLVYVTSSPFKQREIEMIEQFCVLQDGSSIGERFHFDVRSVEVKEELEVSIDAMVKAEAASAYARVRVPCIVEHAGLIFDDYESHGYPGGLTKPMWNALGSAFVQETRSSGRRAVARAVVAYCDGQKITTFTGETQGTIADEPKGSYDFYWDTIFVPDNEDAASAGLTYAEIVDRDDLGLRYKVERLSQSRKALVNFLEFILAEGPPPLWEKFP